MRNAKAIIGENSRPSSFRLAGGMARPGITGASLRFTPRPRRRRPPSCSPMMPPTFTRWPACQAARSLGHLSPRVRPSGSSTRAAAIMARWSTRPGATPEGGGRAADIQSPEPAALSQRLPWRPRPSVCRSATTRQKPRWALRRRKAWVESTTARWMSGRSTLLASSALVAEPEDAQTLQHEVRRDELDVLGVGRDHAGQATGGRDLGLGVLRQEAAQETIHQADVA